MTGSNLGCSRARNGRKRPLFASRWVQEAEKAGKIGGKTKKMAVFPWNLPISCLAKFR
jgi:hypothetical protein